MTESEIDDRDEAVFEAIGGDPEDLSVSENGSGPDTDDAGDTVEVPEDEWTAVLDRLAALESRVSEIERDQGGPDVRDSMCTLAKYAKLVENGEADTLGATDRRAVAIYRNWSELAEKLPAGYGITTRRNSRKKHQPSQVKIELDRILDADLAWPQIHRAMKAVAKLSGGELETGEYGRDHITGGLFEYHERSTPDGLDTYKALIEQ